MGLISDRRNKAKQPKNEGQQPKMKKGLFGGSTSHMFPNTPRGGGGLIPKYPPGYYTTPVHHSSSWSHPGQPKYQPNVNPRYQTWVAPRKQPSLGQLVLNFSRLPSFFVTWILALMININMLLIKCMTMGVRLYFVEAVWPTLTNSPMGHNYYEVKKSVICKEFSQKLQSSVSNFVENLNIY